MPRILIVDPLQLAFSCSKSGDGWSTREWFDRALLGVSEIEWEVFGPDAPDLCMKASACDAVVLGGSERTAWEDSTFNDQLLDLIAICKLNRIPFLGICYGAQLLARALGGTVGRHPRGIELGGIEIEATAAGRGHFLFGGGERFRSIASRLDAILKLPEGARCLASSEHTPIQAFDFAGLLFGVEFHPEMNGRDLRDLWSFWVCSGFVRNLPPSHRGLIDQASSEKEIPVVANFGRFVASRAAKHRKAAKTSAVAQR